MLYRCSKTSKKCQKLSKTRRIIFITTTSTSKLDLVKMLDDTSTHKSRAESVASPSPYVSVGPEGKTAHEYLQLVGENSSLKINANFMPDQSVEKIKVQ